MTTIIILNWNGLAETLDCLESLRSEATCASPTELRIIVVDNGSSGADAETLTDLAQSFSPPLEVVVSPRNLGFAGGVNLGFTRLGPECELVLLLNNDARLPTGLVTRLQAAFAADMRLGILGAVLDEGAVLRGPGRIDWNTGEILWSPTPPDREFVEVDCVHGACFAFRRQLLSTQGPFDAGYFAYYEETDFCVRAHAAGWKLGCLARERVPHVGAMSMARHPGMRDYLYFRSRIRFLKRHAPSSTGCRALLYTCLVAAPRAALRPALRGNLTTTWANLRGLVDGLRNAPPTWPPIANPPASNR